MSASLPKIVDYVISEAVPAKVVLTVHDSVMLEVQEKCLSEVAHECRRIMRSHNSNGVPIDVEAKVGRTWGSMTDFKFTK
jgi:DNA polymerase I-like protein with 3'-5' exonuclease and polymerase domains